MNRLNEQIDFSPDSANHYRSGWLIYGAALLMIMVMLGRNALTGGEGDLAWGLQMAKNGKDLFRIDFTEYPQLKWLCHFWAFPAKLFGTSELVCRLPAAIAALLTLDGTMRLAAKFFNLRSSCTAGWLLLGSFGFLHWGRHGSMYMICCAVLVWCAVFLCSNEMTFTQYYAFFLLSTFGFCVWGMQFIIPWLGIWILKKNYSFKPEAMLMIPAFFSASVTGLWILFLFTLSPEGSINEAFFNLFSGIAEVLKKSFFEAVFPGKMWSLYPEALLNLPRMLLPWTFLTAISVCGMLMRFNGQNLKVKKLIIATGVIFLLIGIFPSRRWQFQLCQLPFFILLTSGSIAGECGKVKFNQFIGTVTSWIFSIIGALTTGLAITWPLWDMLFRISPPLLLMTIVPISGLMSIVFLVFDTGPQSAVEKRSGMHGPWSGYILAGVCLSAAFYTLTVPAMTRYRTERRFWSQCGAVSSNMPPEKIIFYGYAPKSTARYYLDLPQGITELYDDGQFLRHFRTLAAGEAVLILRKIDLDAAKALLAKTKWHLTAPEPLIREGEKVRLFSGKGSYGEEFLIFKVRNSAL